MCPPCLRAHTQVRPYNNFIKYFRNITLEPIAKPIFPVILNKVNDLKLLKIRDSSLRSE
jgi:hypothetical protein